MACGVWSCLLRYVLVYGRRINCMCTRVRELWNAHPPSTASPFGRINLERHKPQHPSTGHPISFGLGFGLGFGSGGRRQAPRPKPPSLYMYPWWYYIYTWYQVFVYISSSIFHRRCISNSRTRVRIKCCRYPSVIACDSRGRSEWTLRSSYIYIIYLVCIQDFCFSQTFPRG